MHQRICWQKQATPSSTSLPSSHIDSANSYLTGYTAWGSRNSTNSLYYFLTETRGTISVWGVAGGQKGKWRGMNWQKNSIWSTRSRHTSKPTRLSCTEGVGGILAAALVRGNPALISDPTRRLESRRGKLSNTKYTLYNVKDTKISIYSPDLTSLPNPSVQLS